MAQIEISSPVSGQLVQWLAASGAQVQPAQILAIVESMKMEFEVRAMQHGVFKKAALEAGSEVKEGTVLGTIESALVSDNGLTNTVIEEASFDALALRQDLAAVLQRHASTLDAARPQALQKRHAKGRQSARENLAALVDSDSFEEYGAFAVAAQTQRRSMSDLIANTPADGLICGTARVQGVHCAIFIYDETVLAGTQGARNHMKMDRLLDIAIEQRLPTILFAEGGGGRPGDVDMPVVAGLNLRTFDRFALLAETAVTIGVAAGYCFAGNAALFACCDITIATRDANIGMGGPAMIEGGGLGSVAPTSIGPAAQLAQLGGLSLVVLNEQQACLETKRLIALFCQPRRPYELDHRLPTAACVLIPENRLRAYDVMPVLEHVADEQSLVLFYDTYGQAVLTGLLRIHGQSVAFLASNPMHFGGAIDTDAARKAAKQFDFCSRHQLPLLSLIDTPGFMVGLDTEAKGQAPASGELFRAAARFHRSHGVQHIALVIRKCYGLGGMALAGGSLYRPSLTLAWPSAEFGAMGLEGAVRLGWRKELAACQDDTSREALFDQLLAEQIAKGSAINTAMHLEIDAVIDPAQTRERLALAFHHRNS